MVDTGPPGRSSKKMTPLLWIVLGAVVVILGIVFFGPDRDLKTPSGGEVAAELPPGSNATTTAGPATTAPGPTGSASEIQAGGPTTAPAD